MAAISQSSTSPSPLALRAILVLALLSAVAPLATDMYLPGFPAMASDLGSGAAGIQMTLTSFLLGLAAGQLLIGPISDRFGRRGPLLIGTGVAVLSGILCALAPDVESLVLLRLLQGLGGAAGVVLARAVIADRAPDAVAAARLFQLMMMITGVAPIVAPIAGAGIVSAGGWRAVLAVIAFLSIVSYLGVARFIDETLEPERRTPAGFGAQFAAMRSVIGNRFYLGYTLTMAFAFMVMFAYISASPFVFQTVLGLSATAYSVAFGANAVGVLVFGAVSAKLVGRVSPRRLAAIGLGIAAIASGGLCGVILAGGGAMLMMPLIFLAVAANGLVFGNASALAISRVPKSAGTASAVLGALQFCLGAFASPLVGLGGDDAALPMAVTMLGASVLAIASFFVLAGRDGGAPGEAMGSAFGSPH
jgi:DHA1 family bicyclomycin/chloramphenicol resistance-like MFS transporter